MIGWLSFIISWCVNLLFYKLHPSSVDFNKGRFRARKGFIHIRGRKIIMAPKEENTVLQVRQKNIFHLGLKSYVYFDFQEPEPDTQPSLDCVISLDPEKNEVKYFVVSIQIYF